MKPPKTNIQEILYTMIKDGEVSIMNFPYLSSFRTRISDLNLKHGLKFETYFKTKKNKFRNSYTYAVHKLADKESAIKLYNQLNK